MSVNVLLVAYQTAGMLLRVTVAELEETLADMLELETNQRRLLELLIEVRKLLAEDMKKAAEWTKDYTEEKP